MFDKPILWLRLVSWSLSVIWADARRKLVAAWNRNVVQRIAQILGVSAPEIDRDRSIVIVGANFAGYRCAKILSDTLPLNSRYRIVCIEPNSHFQFTWVLPRFCVVGGHEHKAFVPYGSQLAGAPEGAVRWVRDRVVEVTKTAVKLQKSDDEIPYDFLVIATGSEITGGLPTRANTTEKAEAVKLLREMQQRIEASDKIVVVGGGAAGTELATDAQCRYPEKKVTLVHSRHALLHRLGTGLQESALNAMEKLGGDVILNDRVVNENSVTKEVTLQSGRVIECDLFINCTGQKPASGMLTSIAPNAISNTGHVKVKPTLRIDDDTLANIYICGDVADTNTPNPNSRSASRQASIVADNILLEIRGKPPRYTYEPSWADGGILLTIGLKRAMVHWGDGKRELLFEVKEDEALKFLTSRAWTGLGEKPYEDASYMTQEGSLDIKVGE